jgi:hypothetical protein
MKLGVGESVVRFLPPTPDKKTPFRVVWTHYVPGAQPPVSFACPQKEANELCPYCEKADQYRKTGNKVDYDKVGKLLPRRRVYANVVDMNNPDKGVQVLAFGKDIHEQLVKIRQRSESRGGGNFSHPIDGFDIIIERTGTGQYDTEYEVVAARDKTKLANLAWIEQQLNLDVYGDVKSYEEIVAMLGGGKADVARTGGEKELNPKRARAQDRMSDEFGGGASKGDDIPY